MDSLKKIRDENRLVSRLKARDPKAFESLIKKYHDLVLNLLFRMGGDREEAEDLAQEVFVTVFKQIDTFRGDSSISTWICRIASNHHKNRQRYLKHRQHYSRPEVDSDRIEGSDASETMRTSARISRPDEMVEGLQMEALVQGAINELDDEQRLIVVLRDVQNMAYEEISTITGLPLGTVKSRLHRARMVLKEKLAPHLR